MFDKGGPFFDRVRAAIDNGVGSCPHAEHRRVQSHRVRQRRRVSRALHLLDRHPQVPPVARHPEEVVLARRTAEWITGFGLPLSPQRRDQPSSDARCRPRQSSATTIASSSGPEVWRCPASSCRIARGTWAAGSSRVALIALASARSP